MSSSLLTSWALCLIHAPFAVPREAPESHSQHLPSTAHLCLLWLWGAGAVIVCIYREETEAPNGLTACPSPQGLAVAELEFTPRPLMLESLLLATMRDTGDRPMC